MGVLCILVFILQKLKLSSCLVFFSWVNIIPKYISVYCYFGHVLCFFGCMCLWVSDHSHTTLFYLLVYLFWVHYLLIILSLCYVLLALYNHFWFFVFVGVSRMGVMHGVLFLCRPQPFIYMLGERLVELGILVESY